MIEIDFESNTFICPYCGCRQSYAGNVSTDRSGYELDFRAKRYETDIELLHIKCTNRECSKITVVARDIITKKQFDLYPQHVHKDFPDFVPSAIRADYVEAVTIMQESPKASATLLRRCLQGMIRDFWGIKKNKLKDEIDELQLKVPPKQWKAIDGLRRLGNIGAHMEKDINLIVDIDEGEAEKLAKLVELLIENWYVARHDEEELYKSITATANNKKSYLYLINK